MICVEGELITRLAECLFASQIIFLYLAIIVQVPGHRLVFTFNRNRSTHLEFTTNVSYIWNKTDISYEISIYMIDCKVTRYKCYLYDV